MSDTTIENLREFIKTFEASLDPRLWMKLVKEETLELAEELAGVTWHAKKINRAKVLKEATDLMYVTVGFNLVASGPEQLGLFSDREHQEMMTTLQESTVLHEQAIAYLGDVNYIEAFRRVHNSNMSKLDDDGNPIKRKDGKIMKSSNYKEPKLDDLVSLVIT